MTGVDCPMDRLPLPGVDGRESRPSSSASSELCKRHEHQDLDQSFHGGHTICSSRIAGCIPECAAPIAAAAYCPPPPMAR